MDHINEKHERIINDFEIKEFEDLGGLDLSDKDFTNVPIETLQTIDFDTLTKWPSKDKLPKGFNPEIILEEGKNPGLGIRKLHEQGITGKGIVVGIIDQRISPTHAEFKNNIISNKDYYEPETLKRDTEVSMHGPAVISLLDGKNCGIAPDTKVIYGNINASIDGFWGYIKALEDIIEYNKTNEQKIKIVSVSKGSQEGVPGLKVWVEIKKKAENSGIIVIDSDYFNDNSITGGGSKTNKDSFDNYELPLFYNDSQKTAPTLEEIRVQEIIATKV